MAIYVVNGQRVEVTGLSAEQQCWIDEHLPRDKLLNSAYPGLRLEVSNVRHSLAQGVEPGVRRVPLYDSEHYTVDVNGDFVAEGLRGIANHRIRLVGESRDHFILEVDSTCPLAPRTPLRALRTLTRGRLLEQGGVLVHASLAVTPSGAGILFVGESGAGKTSAAIFVALATGARLVSTDRLIVASGGEVRGYGGPEVHRLGVGLARTVGVGPDVWQSGVRATENGQVPPEADAFGARWKYELSFGALERAGIRGADSGGIHALVNVQSSEGAQALARRTAQWSWKALSDEIFHPDPRLHFPFARSVLSKRAASGALTVASRGLPTYEVRWNRRDPARLRETIDRLVELD